MEDILYSILVAGDEVIPWAAALLLGLLTKYLKSKIDSDTGDRVVQRAVDEVQDAVAEVYQTFVSGIKKGRADGKLTQDEKDAAKRAAVEIAKANLGRKGFERLMSVLGLDEADAESWVESKVEASVAGMKERQLPFSQP